MFYEWIKLVIIIAYSIAAVFVFLTLPGIRGWRKFFDALESVYRFITQPKYRRK